MSGVGSLVGAWLAAAGGSNIQITLLGRSGHVTPSPLLAALYQFHSAVTMARCDVGVAEEAAAAATGSSDAEEAGSWKPLSGIVHAGGVLADGMIPKQTAASIRTVFAPKVSSLRSVHEKEQRRQRHAAALAWMYKLQFAASPNHQADHDFACSLLQNPTMCGSSGSDNFFINHSRAHSNVMRRWRASSGYVRRLPQRRWASAAASPRWQPSLARPARCQGARV